MPKTFPFLFFICSFMISVIPSGFADDSEYYTWDELYEEGEQWVEENVPENVQEMLVPSRQDWTLFWRQLEDALHSEDFEDLAWILPEVRAAVAVLRRFPETQGYAAWLEQRLDYCEMSAQIVKAVPVTNVKTAPPPKTKKPTIVVPKRPVQKTVTPVKIQQKRSAAAQNKQNWKNKIAAKPRTAGKEELIPSLKKEFSAEGVAPQWVWVAEVESSLNPDAKSPVGAAGLFQFMPATAQRFGLKTSPVDERKHPQKSARAAAKYLKVLYGQFKSWPLVFAAYNSGEGRVGKLLKKHNKKTFEEIAEFLPAETQMYVPKVLATVELRENVDADKLPPPKKV
jgi:membrane-bound lytic murein transglycosylase D